MKKIIILFGIFILSIGAYASETLNGTEGELTNPILGGSELGNWGEPYDEHDIYKVDGDRSSGYLMEIWWVTATGEVGFTDEGWSRVPKADRSRIFRTEAEEREEEYSI